MKKQIKITIPTTAEEIEISIIPVDKKSLRFECQVPVFGIDIAVLKEAMDEAEKFRAENMQDEKEEKLEGSINNLHAGHED